jgi:hypothetical protein
LQHADALESEAGQLEQSAYPKKKVLCGRGVGGELDPLLIPQGQQWLKRKHILKRAKLRCTQRELLRHALKVIHQEFSQFPVLLVGQNPQ